MHHPLRGCAIAGFMAAVALGPSVIARAQSNQSNHNLDVAAQGHQIFMAMRCYACHGEYGFGTVGPQFRENRFIGLSDYIVGQILVGRGIMPSFAQALDNQQIAALATYIRSSWGNNFGPVNASEVAHVREQVKLNPPQGPHVPPEDKQPSGTPMPPQSPLPPGQAQPPGPSH